MIFDVDMTPGQLRLWLACVGVATIVSIGILIAKGRKWTLADKQAGCDHEYRFIDGIDLGDVYRCRKCDHVTIKKPAKREDGKPE